MVEQGRIDHAADVLYLDVDEVEHGKHDLRAVVHRRRAEHERKKTLTPPTVIGGEVARRAAHPVLPADSVIRGLGASHGVASGRARLVLDLADAHRVDPGDVLVCVMTAPPWTPLFGIAGAIVTDSGGLGSHAAIAAREYGIPAVVGTSIATAVIPDGAFVTVDGTAGTVHLS